MAENPSGPARPLDVQRLHYLVRLMKRYDLTALDVIDSSVQIRLRRSSPHAVVPHVVAQPPVMSSTVPLAAATSWAGPDAEPRSLRPRPRRLPRPS